MKAIALLIVMTLATFILHTEEAFPQEKLNYEYPELVVTPRASDRLKEEARAESRAAWTDHIHVQGPALLTILAAMSTQGDRKDDRGDPLSKEDKDRAKNSGQLGLMVGGGILVTTAALSATYRPYKSCWRRVKKMKSGSKREQLTRERYAEECFESKAGFGRILSWTSTIVNVAAAGLLLADSQESTSRGLAGLATIAAFTPLFIDYAWETTWEHHQDYKKRVYGPVAGLGVIADPIQQVAMPAFAVTFFL